MIKIKQCRKLVIDDALVTRLGMDIVVEDCDEIYMRNFDSSYTEEVEEVNYKLSKEDRTNLTIDEPLYNNDSYIVSRELLIRELIRDLYPNVTPIHRAKLIRLALKDLYIHHKRMFKSEPDYKPIDPKEYADAINSKSKIRMLFHSLYPDLDYFVIDTVVFDNLLETLDAENAKSDNQTAYDETE